MYISQSVVRHQNRFENNTFDSYIAIRCLYLNMEWRGAIEYQGIESCICVFIHLLAVYLFIYLFICLFIISEIHGGFSKRSEVDLYWVVILEKIKGNMSKIALHSMLHYTPCFTKCTQMHDK